MVWMFLSTDSDGLDVQVKLEREWKPSSTISGECSFAFLVPSTFFFFIAPCSPQTKIFLSYLALAYMCVCVTTTNYVHLSCTHRHPVCVSELDCRSSALLSFAVLWFVPFPCCCKAFFLFVFFLALACGRISNKMHRIESRHISGSENTLFAGGCMYFSAWEFYGLGQ